MTVLWRPPADVLDRCRIGDYIRRLPEGRLPGKRLPEEAYHDLWQWSVDDVAGFWRSIWEYFEVIDHGDAHDRTVLADDRMPGARWFPGARINYAEHVLRMPGVADDAPMVIAHSQTREPVILTAAGLREQVRRARAGLRRLGVREGDRVAVYAPTIPETFILLLASASLGAIFSSCAPEFGTRSVVDRWQQIEPTVLFAVDGYRYGDKEVDRTDEVAAIRAALPSLTAFVRIPYLTDGEDWRDFTRDTDEPLDFAPLPFEHPLYVLYSSGTTGLPKPIVHGHGGILVEHLKMLALHLDLGPGDRFFWFTTTGWMMWNFLVSAPAVGAAVVFVDGNPAYPDLGWLWRIAQESGATYFGTSAPFLMSCRKAGLTPRTEADLSRIRGIGSTGSPLPPEGFTYVYENVSPGALLASVSGGTDVCTAFVGGVPLLPVYDGEISCRCLGARVEAFAADGTSVIDELGELVITRPMPSMPVGFWGDQDGSRYAEAYFGVYPHVWRHGDWITITSRGTCVITGRSDATLNRGGVRLGTAEFYSVVEGLPEVVDSVVVHLEDTGELLLFVVLAPGLDLDADLEKKIARELRTALSPRHVPDAVHRIASVPKTLSGKKLEVPVKRILSGVPADQAAAKGALANPDSLTAFTVYAQSRVR